MSPLDFAVTAHNRQRYGDHPYRYHLVHVAEVLARFGYTDAALVAAAFLHDVVEDTDTTVDTVVRHFGAEVADLVSCVTTIEAPTRKEKLDATYPRIRANTKAVALKLADRIANVEESIKTRPKLFAKYNDEFPGFREGLYREGEHEELWSHLTSLLS